MEETSPSATDGMNQLVAEYRLRVQQLEAELAKYRPAPPFAQKQKEKIPAEEEENAIVIEPTTSPRPETTATAPTRVLHEPANRSATNVPVVLSPDEQAEEEQHENDKDGKLTTLTTANTRTPSSPFASPFGSSSERELPMYFRKGHFIHLHDCNQHNDSSIQNNHPMDSSSEVEVEEEETEEEEEEDGGGTEADTENSPSLAASGELDAGHDGAASSQKIFSEDEEESAACVGLTLKYFYNLETSKRYVQTTVDPSLLTSTVLRALVAKSMNLSSSSDLAVYEWTDASSASSVTASCSSCSSSSSSSSSSASSSSSVSSSSCSSSSSSSVSSSSGSTSWTGATPPPVQKGKRTVVSHREAVHPQHAPSAPIFHHPQYLHPHQHFTNEVDMDTSASTTKSKGSLASSSSSLSSPSSPLSSSQRQNVLGAKKRSSMSGLPSQQQHPNDTTALSKSAPSSGPSIIASSNAFSHKNRLSSSSSSPSSLSSSLNESRRHSVTPTTTTTPTDNKHNLNLPSFSDGSERTETTGAKKENNKQKSPRPRPMRKSSSHENMAEIVRLHKTKQKQQLSSSHDLSSSSSTPPTAGLLLGQARVADPQQQPQQQQQMQEQEAKQTTNKKDGLTTPEQEPTEGGSSGEDGSNISQLSPKDIKRKEKELRKEQKREEKEMKKEQKREEKEIKREQKREEKEQKMLKKELKEGLLRELKEGERIDPDVDYFVVRKDEHMEEVLERLKERLKKTKKVWTSDNCPMDIAWIPSSELHLRNPDGKIGICMCPGRNKPKKRHVWQRDLSKDLDRMKQVYGCDVLVTLIRRQEMEEMRLLDNFFPEVDKHAIESFWLPIKDKWIPNSMLGLMNLVERILMRLHQGKRVVVHCNGGKGRSATVIVATMVALGRSIGESTNIIQSTRGGTLRNPLQQAYLRRFKREWKERRKERERRYKRRLKSRKKKDKDMMKAMVKVRVMEEISRLTSQQQQSPSSSFSAPPSTATTPAMTKKNNSSNNNLQKQMLADARKRTSLAAEDERRVHTEKEESEKEDKAKPTKEEDKDKESHLKMVKTFKRKKRKGLFNKKHNSSSLNMKTSWGESSQSQSSCSESEDEDDSLAVFLRTREELVEEVQGLERKVASAEVKLQERKLRLAQAKKELEQFASVDHHYQPTKQTLKNLYSKENKKEEL